MDNRIDELLEKKCYIIDFLPEQVKPDAGGQYFAVEYYLLNSDRSLDVRDKFVSIILKLMCYYHVSVLWNGWIDRPTPEVIDEAVKTIMENHSGTLNVLLPDENVLVVFDWDCLCLSVYNPAEEMHGLMEKIAFSEGMFWREAAE